MRNTRQPHPVFSSLRVCRQCDKPLSIAEHIEDFCESCNRPFMAEAVELREVPRDQR